MRKSLEERIEKFEVSLINEGPQPIEPTTALERADRDWGKAEVFGGGRDENRQTTTKY